MLLPNFTTFTQLTIIPFLTILNHEFSQTNQGKKKFRILTKKNIFTKHDLINKLNNAMTTLNQKCFLADIMSQMK